MSENYNRNIFRQRETFLDNDIEFSYWCVEWESRNRTLNNNHNIVVAKLLCKLAKAKLRH